MVIRGFVAAWLAALALPAVAGVVVTDAAGQRVELAKPATRIISLAPHLTEELFAIGAGNLIVGAVDYSDYPPAAKAIRRIGGYNGLDLEAIRLLKPDLIVAWQTGNPERQLADLKKLGIPIYINESNEIKDIPESILKLGTLSGHEAEAGKAAAQQRARWQALQQRYAGKAPVRVFYQVWNKPLMTIGSKQILNDAIRLCGGVNVFGQLPAVTLTVDTEAVLAANPQIIVTGSEQGAKTLDAWRSWTAMAAVKNHQLYGLNPDLLSRMGPRFVDGVAELCRAIDQARQP